IPAFAWIAASREGVGGWVTRRSRWKERTVRAKVLVVDELELVVQGLRATFEPAPDFEVVAEAFSGEQAVDAAYRSQPDLTVLGLRLPDGLAPEVCPPIRRAAPRTKVLVLAMRRQPVPVGACLDAGAGGVLLKDVASPIAGSN